MKGEVLKNANRPDPGSVIRVDPIRELSAIDGIKVLLTKQPRNFALFVLGINTNLRAIDLLGLRVGQVAGLRPGSELVVREKKTGKIRAIPLNGSVHAAILAWLAQHPRADQAEAPLFASRTGEKALSVPAMNRLVKRWCHEVGLEGNYGCHTLRKTFGYQHRVHFGTDLPTLMTMFNHSSQRQTLTYLGIQPEEIRSAYMKEL